jgi:hypothetical protein
MFYFAYVLQSVKDKKFYTGGHRNHKRMCAQKGRIHPRSP